MQSATTSNTESADYGDSLFTLKEFSDRYPHLYPNTGKLRWLFRDRTMNGLIESGAAVEVYIGTQQRPRLYVHAPSFWNWMRSGGSRGSHPQT
jgi:hypothetical protein